jgi:hypothetical protein
MMEFRKEIKLHERELFDSNVKLLYEFVDYIETHYKIQFKK